MEAIVDTVRGTLFGNEVYRWCGRYKYMHRKCSSTENVLLTRVPSNIFLKSIFVIVPTRCGHRHNMYLVSTDAQTSHPEE